MEIGEERDMLREQLKDLQQNFIDERKKADKGAKTNQVLQKDFRLEKTARKAVDISTCLHSYIF